MDALLLCDPYTGCHLMQPQQSADLKAKIKEIIIKYFCTNYLLSNVFLLVFLYRLFSKNKKQFDCTLMDEGGKSWKNHNPDELLECKTISEENNTIFPMHSILCLKNSEHD